MEKYTNELRRTFQDISPGDKINAYRDGDTWNMMTGFVLDMTDGIIKIRSWDGNQYIEYDASQFIGTDEECFELDYEYIKEYNK